MEDQEQTCFTFEIDNFSEKEDEIVSPNFLSGGCEWYVEVCPKGDTVDDHLSLYLCVANPESLRLGWKRRATYSLIILNQSGKELFIEDESCKMFCAQFTGWGWAKVVPLKELQEEGFIEKNKLIIRVEVKVVEVVDEGDDNENEAFDYEGFQILYSQVFLVSWIFDEHPDFAVNVRPKNQRVKTTYMNILLDLIETLDKPPRSITESELSNAQSDLIDLTEAGFKLDWLKTKLDEVSLERKKANATDGSRVQELEEHIKNLKVELNEEKIKTATVSDLKDEVSYLKAEVSNLRAELNKEKGKSAAKFMSLEQTVLNLRAELNKEKGVISSWDVLDYA
ncbi:unnamed protein product [Microthlaspi erraticum]|uniref:MATH domain-containing protein n=1 Tax=Microthlaspi erraticum TaxID=1685480 RepID=A0A6D2JZP3_9BRAS|nr:unnamed protein product [Microthlaspi erraticum]